jgi:hypothetical protein
MPLLLKDKDETNAITFKGQGWHWIMIQANDFKHGKVNAPSNSYVMFYRL